MKSKKPKPRRADFSTSEAAALSMSLDFLLHADSFSYTGKGFTYKDARSAAWKFDSPPNIFTNAEMLAASASVELVLQAFSVRPGLLAEVSKVYPDLIPDLQDCFPTLQRLSRYFHELLF